MSIRLIEQAPQVDVIRDAVQLWDQAQKLRIATESDYLLASEMWKACAEIQKQIDSTFDPIIRKAHEAHKTALEQKRQAGEPVERAKGAIGREIQKWKTEQERLRQDEERRLREIARKEDEERRLREAEELAAQGCPDLADVVLEMPAPPPTVIVEPAVPKVKGVGFTTSWKFRITNPNLLPREYLIPDEAAIGKVVRALKDKTQIPGVEVYSEQSIRRG